MSITQIYQAEEFPVDGREYDFTFESIGSAAFELWAEDALENKWLIPSNTYSVSFNGPRPIFDGGTVILGSDPDANVFKFIAVRNTPIDQTVDYQEFDRFPEVMVEFTLDKLVMIIQELTDRLCNVTPGWVPNTEQLQPLVWYSYDGFSAKNINYSLDQITQMCLELDQNKIPKEGLPP